MGALLIGEQIDGAVSLLNEQLRANTVEYAQRKLGRIIPSYSPWLCFAPVTQAIPPSLITFNADRQGGLALNDAFLAEASAFLAVEGRAAIDELPGDPDVWLPNRQNISSTFEAAAAVIDCSDATIRQLYAGMVDYVVPLGGGRNRGYSTHLCRGAIFRSLPADNDEYDVAIDIIHEVGHHVLMAWQSVDPIITSPHDAPVFSQIRRADRPAIQSFHAAVALAYMLYLAKTQTDDARMQAAAERRGRSYTDSLSHSLGLAIDAVRKECVFTEVGETMLDEMEAVI